MTTDITELAQSLKAAAVRVIKNYDSEWFEAGHQICTVHKSKINLISLANPVNVLALVEALEYYKSREERVTSLVRDNSKSWDELYRQVEAKDKRNAELVEALEKAQTINAAAEKLVRCKGRYHSEQNYRALAALFGVTAPDLPPIDDEPCTVTVKLPDLRQIVSGDRYVWSDGVFNYSQDVKAILADAGIKVEAE